MNRILFLFVVGGMTLMFATVPVGLADKIDHGFTGFSINSAFAKISDALNAGRVR